MTHLVGRFGGIIEYPGEFLMDCHLLAAGRDSRRCAKARILNLGAKG